MWPIRQLKSYRAMLNFEIKRLCPCSIQKIKICKSSFVVEILFWKKHFLESFQKLKLSEIFAILSKMTILDINASVTLSIRYLNVIYENVLRFIKFQKKKFPGKFFSNSKLSELLLGPAFAKCSKRKKWIALSKPPKF